MAISTTTGAINGDDYFLIDANFAAQARHFWRTGRGRDRGRIVYRNRRLTGMGVVLPSLCGMDATPGNDALGSRRAAR